MGLRFLKLFLWIFSITVASGGILVAANEPWRQNARHWLELRSRKVLSQASGALTATGNNVTVLKVQSLDSLFLEIYDNDEEGRPTRFRERIVIDGYKDAAFKYKGTWVKLLLLDVDGEPGLEIIAPSFNLDYVPTMNVYKLDAERGLFRALSASDIQSIL